MCHTALGFYTGFLPSPMTDVLALSHKNYVTRPSSKKRRYTFQRMSHRTHLTLNSLRMFMISHNRYTPHRSLMIIATLILTAVPHLLVNHNHPQSRRSTREQRVIRTLPAPLRKSSISVTTIITITIIAMAMTTTMVIITIDLPLTGVQLTVHPWLRMYTPMVIRDHDLFHASHPSALPVKGLLYGSIRSPSRPPHDATFSQALRRPHANGVRRSEDADGQASVTDHESAEGFSERDSLTSVE